MRHLIDELTAGKIIGDIVQPVQPVKLKAAQAIVALSQQLEHETAARIKAENISGYSLEECIAILNETNNNEQIAAFL